MRILHVTDFHFRQRWFDWLLSHCREYDAVCFTGDFITLFVGPPRTVADSRPSSLTRLMRPTRAPNVRSQASWVQQWLKEWPATTPLFLCSGNHDYWPQQEHFTDTDADGGWLRKMRRPANIWTDEESATIYNQNFQCVPWARAPKVESVEPVVVLVHAPPAGTDISSERANDAGGDAAVTQAAHALSPGSVLLCGHVHHPRAWFARLKDGLTGKTIWAFNPGFGAADAAEPNFIVLDTTTRQAEYHAAGRTLTQSFPDSIEQ